jgi:hypothetical protein
MSVSLRNLRFLRNVRLDGFSEFGPKLYEALKDSENAHNTLESQVNGNLSGLPAAPPQLSALRVVAGSGIFHFSIDHNADFYRGVNYHLEYAEDPQFGNPFPIDIGSAREHRSTLGPMVLYARASASYGISPPGPWVYYGGATPQPINGALAGLPPLPAQSSGSGTGFPLQGLSGPGQTAFRGTNPPVRNS